MYILTGKACVYFIKDWIFYILNSLEESARQKLYNNRTRQGMSSVTKPLVSHDLTMHFTLINHKF